MWVHILLNCHSCHRNHHGYSYQRYTHRNDLHLDTHNHSIHNGTTLINKICIDEVMHGMRNNKRRRDCYL